MLSPNRLGIVAAIEKATAREAIHEYLPMQPGETLEHAT